MIGLGNPGACYDLTRHNAGFRTVDILAKKLNVRLKKPFFHNCLIGKGIFRGSELYLVKPLTFMNRSGEIMPAVLKMTGAALDQVLVVCDTLDLSPGVCRLKRRGASAGHKGLSSIITRLGTGAFMRLYIGVGRPADREGIIDYVLREPGPEEGRLIGEALQIAAVSILKLLLEEPEVVMNVLNKRKSL